MARRHPRTRRLTGLALAAALAALPAGCGGGEPGAAPPPTTPGGVTAGPDIRLAATLQPFDSCDEVLRWFQDEAVKRLGPNGDGWFGYDRPMPATGMAGGRAVDERTTAAELSAPAAPQASDDATSSANASSSAGGPTFSGTNVQEAGVDEPDIVKTDGRRLLSVAGRELRIVDLTGPSPTLAGRLTLPVPVGPATRLLLRGDRVLAITEGYDLRATPVMPTMPMEDRAAPGVIAPPNEDVFAPPGTRLTMIDISAPATPQVTSTVVVDGRYIDARLVDGRARVVTVSSPDGLPLVHPSGSSEESREVARRANEDVIRRSKLEDWLPRVRPGDKPDAPGDQLVACDQLRHPKEFGGVSTLSVLAVDLGQGTLDLSATTGLTADGDLAYASGRTLYVGTTAVSDLDDGASRPRFAPARTAIHAFGLGDPGPAVYRASGVVDGAVRDRWSLSEHDGHLRVVSTTFSPTSTQQSQVSVLAEQGGELKVVGTAGDMGKGEQVKSVRFIGDRGYVVTFRQIDPLYVLDLADPARPRVTGELKVPGYSGYRHPVGDGLLLGVGQDATETGRSLGLKVSLFDVSDPANPRELDNDVVPNAYSEVEHDSRAFLWWAPTRLALVPTQLTAHGYRVRDDGVEQVGRIETVTDRADRSRTHSPIRSVVVGDSVLTVTTMGVRVSALDTLASEAWLPL